MQKPYYNLVVIFPNEPFTNKSLTQIAKGEKLKYKYVEIIETTGT